jgi:hypothetical protein
MAFRDTPVTRWGIVAAAAILIVTGFYFISSMEPNNHSTPSVASNPPDIKGPTPH